MALYRREESVPLPPKNAEAYNTVCQYCTVGCGYKVYIWPEGYVGGLKAGDNAFGIDFTTPQPPLAGFSYTESMHSTIRKRDGHTYHVAIVPAHEIYDVTDDQEVAREVLTLERVKFVR